MGRRHVFMLLFVAACSGGASPTTTVPAAAAPTSTMQGPQTGTSVGDTAPVATTTNPGSSEDQPESTGPTATTPPAATTAPTTTVAGGGPTTTPPPPVAAGTAALAGTVPAGSIGVVGCSNTSRAVNGYLVVSEYDLLAEGGLDAGSMGIWGRPGSVQYDRFWGAYDDRRPSSGYAGTWVQLCPRDRQHSGVFDDSHKAFVEHIVWAVHQRDAGIPIWVSGINTFEDGLVCETAGVEGPAITAEAADWAAATIPGVSRGPDLGPMVAAHLDPGETCHPNAEGRLFLGSQLAAFFDGV